MKRAISSTTGCFRPRYAITFSGTVLLHVGGSTFGNGSPEDPGFSVLELEQIHGHLQSEGGVMSELIDLSDGLPTHLKSSKELEAKVLVIRNAVDSLMTDYDYENGNGETTEGDEKSEVSGGAGRKLANIIENELEKAHWDKKFWDSRTKKTKNKRARYNTMFGDDELAHSDDFKQGTVNSFQSLPILARVRNELLPKLFGNKARGLYAEGNYYFEEKSGIGFHGDAERKIVVCLSVGGPSTIRFRWRLAGASSWADAEHSNPSVDIRIGHGDIYVMSEKATGYDWKKRSLVRVVHAAGSGHYIGSNDVDNPSPKQRHSRVNKEKKQSNEVNNAKGYEL